MVCLTGTRLSYIFTLNPYHTFTQRPNPPTGPSERHCWKQNKYPMLAPYKFASNMPIIALDIDGLEGQIAIYSTCDGKTFVRIEHSSSINEIKNSLKAGYGMPAGQQVIYPENVSLPEGGKKEWLTTPDNSTFVFVDFQTGRINPTATTFNASAKIMSGNLGSLSERWESSGLGPGVVSSGAGDPGGVSYGIYQLASNTGTIQNFMSNEGSKWTSDFEGLTPGTASFSSKWKQIAKTFPDEMRTAQHNYIFRTHYQVSKSKVESALGIDIDSYSR